jgi:predicted helicase
VSLYLIYQYYAHYERAVKYGKSFNEQSIRTPFFNLLNEYARKHNYEVIPEVKCMGTKGRYVIPDGVMKNMFSLDLGLWESKDEKDTIDAEIDSKFKKGYPFYNILFEDSRSAVLIQRETEKLRIDIKDPDALNEILHQFVTFKNEYIYKFEEALDNFKTDIPNIVDSLRLKIDDTRKINRKFVAVSEQFLELCRAEINPAVSFDDVQEMMIQHVLTADIFNKVFDDAAFHQHNNIAKELEKLVGSLFTFSDRKNLMGSIEHYYDVIKIAASNIVDHHEKQKFLKVLYENFYKVYNPKAADRLGVVYTPNEIVNFMIESVDFLLDKHFGKTLSDNNVVILDPATGTGTFITSLIDYMPQQRLVHKYDNEIFANEIAILPYYVANLNIEFTFKQKMGLYREFQNLCFVDTLDNTQALGYQHESDDMFGLTFENSQRIKRQNEMKIAVVIGNPPYNANQMNENENNKNRTYPEVDKRIKGTFIHHSTAQKTKVYDMYARFYRWAMDRLDENGIIAFVTNRSFIDSRTFDGFRKCINDEFSACYIIDTKSDVRVNPKIAGTTHNVFGIQTGVAIMFLVKKKEHEGMCRIHYHEMDETLRKEVKLQWLGETKLRDIPFELISPDEKNNWLNHSESNFEELIPVADKMVKLGKSDKALFKSFSLGVVTNRDDWVYDFDKINVEKKVAYFIKTYNEQLAKLNPKNEPIDEKALDDSIKWTRAVKKDLASGKTYLLVNNAIKSVEYRPFTKKYLYYVKELNEMQYLMPTIFGGENVAIAFSSPGSSQPFQVLAQAEVYDLHLLEMAQCVPLYWYDEDGDVRDNITDWGLAQFANHYGDDTITKEAIFNYTYAVLHDPAYREKYKIDLKRDFPRLPFYTDFWQWVEWGKKLMELHLNFETVEPFPLTEVTKNEDETVSSSGIQPKNKTRLTAEKVNGTIVLDDVTTLTGVPPQAWEYKLGNRSTLEWILDQYKEKKPKDPTIAEKFNTYKFADHKTKVIDLLKRVTTVSVETMKIIEEMGKTGIGY